MSIALNILKIAQQELDKANLHQPSDQLLHIAKIHLSVGRLSGVVIDSLRFALEASRKESPLLDSEIIIEDVVAKMRCLKCNKEFEADDFYVTCPNCNAFEHEALTGKELMIKSLVVI